MFLSRWLAPWRHKVIFDYILLNNHHLSTLLYPTLQTRIYFCVTIILYTLNMIISFILDFNSQAMSNYSPGIRSLIFLFQTVNLRFCGFQTFDINLFSTATILVYLLLMATKPQMLCALDESPFEIYWLTLETQAQVDNETKTDHSMESKEHSPLFRRAMSLVSGTNSDDLSLRPMHRFLRRQSLVIKELARQEFSKSIADEKSSQNHSQSLKILRMRLFLIHFTRALVKHMFNFFVSTRTWLFVFIFLICAIEYRQMAPHDPDFTLVKIIFEIISAFGGVGMSLGYTGKVTSFASVLSSGSKIILIATMLMGRHRGLLASMKDQEMVEYSAINVLIRRRDDYILTWKVSRGIEIPVVEQTKQPRIAYF